MDDNWAQQFALSFGAWLIASLAVILALELWDPTLYYFAAYVGFLLAVEHSEPQVGRPVWHRRLDVVSVAGLVGFGYVVISWVEQVTGMVIL